MIASQAGDKGVEIMEMDEEDEGGEVFVDVGGAVMKSGLYKLGGGARVNDALVAAGGLSEKADRDWFLKNINLAQKVSDGSKIYIVFKGESQSVGVVSGGQVAGTTVTSKINVNIASVTELDKLWGVGPATAEKIINGRPYSSVEELKTKKVLKSNVYERIKDEVSVY
jgi:competence protein ComEA